MGDMEGNMSVSDVLNNNDAANNVLDNAANNVLNVAANNGVDNAAAESGSTNNLNVPVNSGDELSPIASPKSKLDSSGSSYERVNAEEVLSEGAVNYNMIFHVMRKMRSTHYDTSKNQEYNIYEKCKELFEKDYEIKVVVNDNLCLNYPTGVIVPVCEKKENERLPMDFDVKLYTELIKEAPEARLRSRFVTPAILFDHKFICRSGTLTSVESAAYEQGRRVITTAPASIDDDSIIKNVSDAVYNVGAAFYQTVTSYLDPDVMQKLFVSDVKVLKHLKVERVCDLMVEYAKHYRNVIDVSSSEKANEDVYGELKLEELPFPGCEFFTDYSKANKNPKDLHFEWSQSDVTRCLRLTEDARFFFPEMKVEEFQTWDLIQLTQNYLKIILSYLATGTGGMVVHCISGWDRTPLFISLLRLSLWADGVVHDTLKADEMAYLTVAYDWFLFGHNLPNRLTKNEEIMHFCFNFLENITSDEFSITRLFEQLPPEKKGNRKFPHFEPAKRTTLHRIRATVLEAYEEAVRGREAGDSKD